MAVPRQNFKRAKTWRNYRVRRQFCRRAFDWVQRSSVAADNNRIYAESLVTSQQTHSSVASFRLC